MQVGFDFFAANARKATKILPDTFCVSVIAQTGALTQPIARHSARDGSPRVGHAGKYSPRPSLRGISDSSFPVVFQGSEAESPQRFLDRARAASYPPRLDPNRVGRVHVLRRCLPRPVSTVIRQYFKSVPYQFCLLDVGCTVWVQGLLSAIQGSFRRVVVEQRVSGLH